MKNFQLSELPEKSHIHMVGIGGISMSALALMLSRLGYRVSGSDRTETKITRKLTDQGIRVTIGHTSDTVRNSQLVCYTAAISKNNPELVTAQSLGIPCMERAELLGQLMKRYKFPVAVAGTHGKTTTTSMLSLILLEAGLDPTILVGGELSQIGGNYRPGKEDYLVFEACEYVESFLHFNPFLSVITNVEEDHMDYFTSINHIISAFEKFTRLNSPDGHIIVCSDDKNCQSVVQNSDKNVIKYGIIGESNDFSCENLHLTNDGRTQFDVIAYGEKVTSVSLFMPGEHNVRNALGAFAAAYTLGIDPSHIKAGLEKYTGTKRRFEILGEVNGIKIVDDYAHHPTEIESCLKAAKSVSKGSVWCIFQPHTFSRTKAFTDDFARALSLADKTIVTDVYPAREIYDGTIHSCDIVRLMKNGTYINNFSAIEKYILKNAKPGDTVITMGAGDIFKVGYSLVKNQ